VNVIRPKSAQLSNLLLMLILGGLQAVMPISTDLYLPALPTIARDLSVNPGAVQLTLAVFMLGVALGQVAYGPITDKHGRKTPLLVGLSIYILGTLVCALAPTISALIGGRFLQALGASASAVITAAIARDLWSGKTLADRLSLLFLIIGAAPILAPSLGGLILIRWSWHGLFWFLVAYGLLVAAMVTRLPETSSAQERVQVRLRDSATTYVVLLRNTPFMLYVLTGACAVGMLLTYITGSAFIYIDMLGITPSLFGVLFGVNAVGFVGASQINRLHLRHLSLVSIKGGAVAAAVLNGLLLVAVVAGGQTTTLVLTLLFIVLAATVGCIMPSSRICPGRSVGPRICSIYAAKASVSVPPDNRMLGPIPESWSEAISV
jgi:MFS transporter, DHA1 family, multidrug resistance protein